MKEIPTKDQAESSTDDRITELLEQFQTSKIPNSRRIFANRNLRLSAIKLVGFDMDYTLAQYHVAVEELAVRLTVERMVENLGYTDEIKAFKYDPHFAIRGLALDKRLGNLLKMDSHRHITVAFHGKQRIEKDERRRLYSHERIRMSAERYALIDTLFAVPEAWLFAQIVDMEESQGKKLTPRRYRKIYDDIRQSIDTVHADQSLKNIIMADLPTYIVQDPELGPTLHRLRSAGKRLFVMTNSYGPYSNAVMSFLLNDALPEYNDWRDYFDVIVVGAKKPSFFSGNAPFLELDDTLQPLEKEVTELANGLIYQGGNLRTFERLANASGDRVLYVGDHLYGDILRSKKATMWRTVMIVPEMERELALREDLAADFERRSELETHRVQVDRELSQQQQLVRSLSEFGRDQGGEFTTEEQNAFQHAFRVARRNVRKLERALNRCLAQIWKLNTKIEQAFNPNWGMLFKSRANHSVFGSQVEDYACLYTSRVTNFGCYSPYQYFRTPHDRMPHEHWIPDTID